MSEDTVDWGGPFPALLAGHLVGDWIVQTDWQAAHKVRPTDSDDYWQSWKANQQHMLGYHVALAAAAWPFLAPKQVFRLVAVSWLSHSFIDRRWPVRWLMRHTGSGPFSDTTWGPMCVDQALHLSIIALASAWLDRPDIGSFEVPDV